MSDRGGFMLTKFSVKGFKNFKDKITLDFSNPSDFQFNKELIKDGVVKNAAIYGKNASGKSNLGLALFDIIFHLTDYEKSMLGHYSFYKNLDSKVKQVEFSYEFKFGEDLVTYNYKKDSISILTFEELLVNEETIVRYNYRKSEDYEINIKEAKTLVLVNRIKEMSVVKYILNNSILNDNSPLIKLKAFVDGMLWFRSAEGNNYMGFRNGIDSLHEMVLKNKALEDFEEFLRANDINYKLELIVNEGKNLIGVVFENETVQLDKIASTGTKNFWLYYAWSLFFKNVSFVFIDEYDSNYNFKISANVLKLLKESSNFQSIITTHNTYLMSNRYMRPDCIFIISDNKINSMAKSTEKELREAHNIEKMYRGGQFTE